MVVGLLDNESPDSNRLTLVTPKSENDVRLQATLGNQNPTGLSVGVVSRLCNMLGTMNVKVTKEQLLGLNAMLNTIKK